MKARKTSMMTAVPVASSRPIEEAEPPYLHRLDASVYLDGTRLHDEAYLRLVLENLNVSGGVAVDDYKVSPLSLLDGACLCAELAGLCSDLCGAGDCLDWFEAGSDHELQLFCVLAVAVEWGTRVCARSDLYTCLVAEH